MPYTLLAEIVEDIRNWIDEPTASSISNRYITRQINQGQLLATRDTYLIDDIYAFSTVDDQQEYDLPDNFVKETGVIYGFGDTHQRLGCYGRNELLTPDFESGDAYSYAIDLANKKLLLAPIPAASATATTLNGALTATATTVTVTSTTGFGSRGWFQVDTEVIQYTALTSTTFTGCVRGANGTTAATHLTAAATTWCDVVLFYSRKPASLKTIHTTGACGVTNASATVSGVNTPNWLNKQNVYPGNYLGIGAFSLTSGSETFPLAWYKIQTIDSASQITLASVYGEATSASAGYIITDQLDLLEADCAIPLEFAKLKVAQKVGNTDKATEARDALNYELSAAKGRIIGADRIPVVKLTEEASDGIISGLRGSSYYPPFNW